jgi:dTDP-D-glucose 4,6-dehydratase
MIKNKEEIIKEAETKLRKALKEYADAMDRKSNGERYSIDVIEEDLGNIQKLAKSVLKDTTEELLNSVDEEKEIAKKKKNTKKKE